MTILGVDPGSHGASATNAPLLAGILARSHARVAFCEFVGARPTDAKTAAFAFGRARGVIEGCAGALGLPIVFLTPPAEKRLAEIPPAAGNKDLARTRAIARWPAHAGLFARKCDVDRAEACLIALPGQGRMRTMSQCERSLTGAEHQVRSAPPISAVFTRECPSA
jgi:hypothetical protein